MKLFRRPAWSGDWVQTDEKLPRSSATKGSYQGWQPGEIIQLNGNLHARQRHTAFGVAMDERDAAALMDGLARAYQRTQTELGELRNALNKINSLIAQHADEAPSPESLLTAIQTIANYYLWSWSRAGKKAPTIGWIKWNSI